MGSRQWTVGSEQRTVLSGQVPAGAKDDGCYSGLIAWPKGIDLVEAVYKVSREFPKEEIYGLTAQLRRAAASVPSNIAEGQGRKSTREFLHYLSIAHGSLRELETQLLIAARLSYIDSRVPQNLCRNDGGGGAFD